MTAQVAVTAAAVQTILDGLDALQQAVLPIPERAGAELRRAIERFSTEHDCRRQEVSAWERTVATAAAALNRCERDCQGLQQDLAEAQQRLAFARRRAQASQQALEMVNQAASRFWPHQREFGRTMTERIPRARTVAGEIRDNVHRYVATQVSHSTSSFASSAGVTAAAVAARTTAGRIDLADDARAHVDQVASYGGYLDLVVHGDSGGVQAAIDGERVDLSIDDLETVIRNSPSWQGRAIRLMSCSIGRGEYAQNLANRLHVPVYAPSGVLKVTASGATSVGHEGSWRRFEPAGGSA